MSQKLAFLELAGVLVYKCSFGTSRTPGPQSRAIRGGGGGGGKGGARGGGGVRGGWG